MPETLLYTKLFAPPIRPSLVPRQRLEKQLNQGLQLGHKLTLISAPAGFGKTTLASIWLQANSKAAPAVAIAWLSLDEGDNDLARFLTYLIAALEQSDAIAATFGQEILTPLQSPQPLPAEAILTPLINELASIPDRIVLVLDDYHLIEAQPIHDALGFFIENSPPSIHLVLATREDPPLPISRLRARNQLTELRAADLRFTSYEATDFLTGMMGLELSAEDMIALEDRTEGWVTGLQLAALSLQGSKDVTEFIHSFSGSHRYVLDYLIEEVLGQQSKGIQNFLLQTAVLNHLTASLCNHLIGQDNSQEMLEMLEHANLFIIPLDEERRWYRYHHLFADLLRQRLHQSQPEKVSILHIKAGEWFKDQGFYQEAIKHLLAGEDYQNAAELIKAIGFDMIQQGKHTTVVGWINALPEEFVKEHPYLCVLQARSLQLTGDLETSEARLIDAENAMDSQNYQNEESENSILGLIHSCRAYSSFMIGDHDNTISHAHQALEQLPVTATLTRVQTALYLGIAYRYQGQIHTALDIYNEILPTIPSLGGHSIAVLCYLHLGDLHMEMAQLQRAKELYEQALDSTELHTGRPDMPFTGYVYVSISRILRQWNQLEDAYRLTVKGLALCREWNVADILALSCLELASIHQALGNDEQAQASIQEAGNIFDSFSAWGRKIADAHQAKFDLAHGDIQSAASWAQTTDLAADGAFEFHREIEYLVLARVFIAQRRFVKAFALVERIYRVAQEIGKKQTELEGLILLALVFSDQGKVDEALVHLEQALSIGEPEGIIRIFVDEGPRMADLLQEALECGLAPEYVRRLLAAFPAGVSSQTAVTQTPVDQSDLVEPLSEREIEILQKIAEGLTNPEIADRLYLSLNTVKVHTRNIYSKLDVHNRTQAVAKARALGILSTI